MNGECMDMTTRVCAAPRFAGPQVCANATASRSVHTVAYPGMCPVTLRAAPAGGGSPR
jgi:hypothetical protein